MQISEEVLRDFSRRAFLKASAAGAAVATAATQLGSRAYGSPATTAEKEQFLLDRITFGRNPAMVQEIQTRGYMGFLDWQLQLPGEDPIDDSRLFDPPAPLEDPPFPGGAAYLDDPAAAWPWGKTPYEVFHNPDYFFPGGKMWGHGPLLLARGSWFGQHQLRWVMTDFLQNVHNTYLLQPYQFLFWSSFLKNVIWENALGNYGTLVEASSKGGSMLLYLAQPDSDQFNPNENYARELMELHTLGVKSYIIGQSRYKTFVEADVPEASKILTGWDMHGWHAQELTEYVTPQLGDFRWDDTAHALGTKTISNLGPPPLFPPKDYPGALGPGQAEGEELIADLCAHPLTALNLSRRLVQWFLGDDYKGEFYDPWLRTAVAFFLSGGDLKATIRELFDEAYFDQIAPPGSAFRKVRRPANKVFNAVRALEADLVGDGAAFQTQQVFMGQLAGYWAAPNGYQPENEKWIGTLQPVVRFYYDTIWSGTGHIEPGTGAPVDNGLRVADATLDAIFPASAQPDAYPELAAERLAGGCLTQQELDAIRDILTAPTPPAGDLRRWALFYVLVSPTYQYLC